MNLHEYQAKELLHHYGIEFPPFRIITSKEGLNDALSALQTEQVVIKAQVHAGGRGKAGGVKLAKNREEAAQHIEHMLGMRMVNHQTGPGGIVVEKLLISPIVKYTKEYYLGAAIDRKIGRAVLIASPLGGVEIEDTVVHHPEALLKCPIPLDGKLRSYHLWEVAKFMGWKGKTREQGMQLVHQVAQAFIELDASLLEMNPLVSLPDETLSPLDVKLAIDDNALFRHQEIAHAFDVHQIPFLEASARKHDLAYIALDGNIGCMVNGAGLAMATMDIIEHYGGSPANFLDVGGGASQDKVAEGFNIILQDSKVKSILVNIFGGIMNCETLAKGILDVWTKKTIRMPLIVRLEGTHAEEGKLLLSQLDIRVAHSLEEAAKVAVESVNV